MKRILSSLLALVLAAGLCLSALADSGTRFEDFQPRALNPGETLMRGIDVSQFQGRIDWKAVAASGVDFAIIRVALRGWGAEGRLLSDTRFRENLTEAKNNGILVGAYIYSQATTLDEAREEAQFLVSLVKDYQIDLPLVFDQEFAESGGGYCGRLYDATLSRQEMTDLCNAFCGEVERMGYQSLVYSNPYTLSNFLYADQLSRLWLANHTARTDYKGDYEFWQCSSTGRINGIEGDVDLNFWFANENAPKPVMRFTDVSYSHWAYLDLRLAVTHGWVNGYPDGTFRPGSTLTRADFVTMLARLSGEPLSSGAASRFADVKADKYYAPSVAWAVDAGIVSGFPDGTFHPSDPITREQMAHIMALYLKHIGKSVTPPDGSVVSTIDDWGRIGEWAQSDVSFCYAARLLNGRGSCFEPTGTATRAEAGTVLARLFRYSNGEPAQPEPQSPDPTPVNPDPNPGYIVLDVPELHIGM